MSDPSSSGALLRALPTLDQLAEAINLARYLPDGIKPPASFADEDRQGREYAYRLARAVQALLPTAQTGEQAGWVRIVDLPEGEDPPHGRWLETWKEGEAKTGIALSHRGQNGDDDLIWASPDGRDTVTHNSYAAPTHYRKPAAPTPPSVEKGSEPPQRSLTTDEQRHLHAALRASTTLVETIPSTSPGDRDER